MKKILLIEDDVLYAVNLMMQIREIYPSVEVKHCRYGKDALLILGDEKPDMLLLDAILEEDSTSMAVANEARGYGLPVVFITAFERDDVFFNALKINPAGYLHKPITNLSLKYAIELALSKQELQPELVLPVKKTLHSILLKGRNDILEKVPLESILYIEAFGNYCQIYTHNNRRYTHRMTIKNYTSFLGAEQFVRIYRNYVVNIHYLKSVNKDNRTVLLSGGVTLPFSVKYKRALFDKFKQ